MENYISSQLNIEKLPKLIYRTQVTGSNGERADLVGFDAQNNEVIVFEAEFWAGLTGNQPLGYLQRLRENSSRGNKVLVFICPEARVIGLRGEILRISGIGHNGRNNVMIDGIHMMIITWK